MAASVLIIANPYDAEVMRSIVAEGGYAARVSDGSDQPAGIERERPLAVVLSLRLAAVDGPALLAEIRAGAHGARLPVVLIGDASTGISPGDAVEMGGDQLLLRPVEAGPLLGKLEAAIDGRGADAKLPMGSAKTDPQIDDDGLDVEDLEQPCSLAGDLGITGLPELLARAKRSGFSGRLICRRDEAQKSVFFDDGYPVFAVSSEAHDRLVQMLFREAKIDREQLEAVAAEVRAGRRVGAVLVDRGLIKHDELFPLVRRHITEVICSLFSWATGSYELHPEHPVPDERIRLDLHPWAVIAEGVRRKLGLDRLVAITGGSDARPRLRAAARRAEVIEHAGLTEAERDALSQMDGGATLDEIAHRSSLDILRVHQLVYLLMLLGVVDGAAVVRPTRQADRARGLQIDRQRLRAKHAQVREGDYFALLGVPPGASVHEIDVAHQRMRAEFAPQSLAPELVAELGDELAEIEEVIEEAYQVLSHPTLRQAYREAL